MRKKILAALLAVCMVVSLLPAAALAATFDDVDDGLWAADAIERWAGYGVLDGTGDGKFEPTKVMTRAEFAKMLVTMLGLTKRSDKVFEDVDGDAWYAEVVSIAVAAGIINGRTAEKFDPDAPVSFEEAAVMMCRAFGLAENKGGADWSKESIEKLTELGMIGEGADEHLVVGGECNRAVVAALADSIVAEYVNEDKELTGEIKGVVLVVNGAKAEIKDATVIAPIVVESAEVSLVNTQAEDVKVGGEKSVVAADEKSSVANVSIAGDEPAVEIKGEVTGEVTIEDGATGAVVDVPEDVTVTNVSGNDATVNGDTMESEEKPEETEGSEGTTTPSTGGDEEEPAKPGDDVAAPENPEAHEHEYEFDLSDNASHKMTCECGDVKYEAHTWLDPDVDRVVRCQDCDAVQVKATFDVTDAGAVEGCAHTTCVDDPEKVAENVAPTCVEEGTEYLVCAAAGCGAKITKTVPATGHTLSDVVVDPTCGDTGTRTTSCSECTFKEVHEIAATEQHKFDDGKVTKQATCTEAGEKTFTCRICEEADVVPFAAADEEAGTAAGLGHVWTNWGPEGGQPLQYKRTCKRTGCDAEETCNHSIGYANGKCKTCGKAEPVCKHENDTPWIRLEDTQTHQMFCDDCDAAIGDAEDCVDEDDDGECDKCSGHMHSFADTFTLIPATTTHGKLCGTCGAYDEVADCEDDDDDGECDVCGETMGTSTPAQHSHTNWATTLTQGETTHYYACQESGCTEKKDETRHSFAWDASCGVGGESNSDTHTVKCACGKTATQLCGYACNGVQGTNDTHTMACDTCGGTKSVSCNYSWNGTPGNAGIHMITCECGAAKTVDCTEGSTTGVCGVCGGPVN